MSRTIFENSKATLAFAGLVVAGAAIFAGTLGDRGIAVTPEAAAEREVEPKPAAKPSEGQSFADGTPAGDWYGQPRQPAPIEELIDDAKGFDPRPDRSTDPGSRDFIILDSDREPKKRTSLPGMGDPVDDKGLKNQPNVEARPIAADLVPGARPGSGPPRE